MPALTKQSLERYLRSRFGPRASVVSFGPIGKESSKGLYKQYGYGAPVKITFRVGRSLKSAVLETMSPGPFGHEHMADRAQAMLWDYHTYGLLPRHVKALDVGAFTAGGSLFSVADAEELFVLTQWEEGTSYHVDLERVMKEAALHPRGARERAALVTEQLALEDRLRQGGAVHGHERLLRARRAKLRGLTFWIPPKRREAASNATTALSCPRAKR